MQHSSSTAEAQPIKAPTISFLGGGRITSALIAGLRLAGDRREIVVHDRNLAKTKRLHLELRTKVAGNLRDTIEHAQIVVIAVRPASVIGLLDEISKSAATPRLCVSLAAGIPLTILRAALPMTRWVRAMPSPVCRVGKGLTALCFDQTVNKKDRAVVREFFQKVGQVVEVPEQQFDAFTATYSSSHGYHALAALATAAQRAGLDPDTALTAAAHALADGIQYWRESGLTLDELLHEAATPGGIAAATVTAMDKAGYGRSVQKGLAAGISQARRNAKP